MEPTPTTEVTELTQTLVTILPIVVILAMVGATFIITMGVLTRSSSPSKKRKSKPKPPKITVTPEPVDNALTETIEGMRQAVDKDTLELKTKTIKAPEHRKTESSLEYELHKAKETVKPVVVTPRALRKKTYMSDEPAKHKESFFDKLLGRIPKQEE